MNPIRDLESLEEHDIKKGSAQVYQSSMIRKTSTSILEKKASIDLVGEENHPMRFGTPIGVCSKNASQQNFLHPGFSLVAVHRNMVLVSFK